MTSASFNTDRLSRNTLIAIFLTALCTRLLNALIVLWSDIDLLELDATSYWSLSTWIKENGWAYTNLSNPEKPFPETERMPLYPYFIAVVRTVFSDSINGVLMVQVVLDSITCLFIGSIAALWSNRAGLFAGILAAVSPNMILHSGSILTDTLFLFLFTYGLLMAVRFLTTRTLSPLAGGGILLGVATLTRSLTFPLIGVVAAAAAIISWVCDRSVRRAVYAAGIFALCASLPLAPWLNRNFAMFDTAALSSQSGSHFLFWGIGIAKQYHLNLPFSEVSSLLNAEVQQEAARRGQRLADMDAMQRSALYKDVALNEATTVPLGSYLKSWTWASVVNFAAPAIALHPVVRADKTGSFYEATGSSMVERATTFLTKNGPLFVSGVVGGGILTFLANMLTACGFILLAVRYPWMAVFAALSLTYFCLVNGPVISPKYRLPMEPVLIALMGVAMAEWRAVIGWLRIRLGRTVST